MKQELYCLASFALKDADAHILLPVRLVPTRVVGRALSPGPGREGGGREEAGDGSIARRELALPPGSHPRWRR